MVAEDHTHYATDAESLKDYSSDSATTADYSDDGYFVIMLSVAEDALHTPARRQQKNYRVLKETDIRQFQEDDVTTVSTVLSISKVAAIILLCHHQWSVSNVSEAWFADEDGVRKAVGLLKRPVRQSPNAVLTCGICFESCLRDGIISAACGHPFCKACWRDYMHTSIDGGLGCLTLRCPNPSCGAAVGQDMINLLVSDDDMEKYARYLLRSYIEDNRKIKWCPSPGCEYAVEFVVGSGGFDVSCLCSYSFCWNCTEEAHCPVNCETVVS